EAAPLDDFHTWDTLADTLGKTLHARVTLVRGDGTVIGDSEVPTAGLAGLENHGGREEVVEAMAGHAGSSTRLSQTLRERMMYVARPFRMRGRTSGVARVAMPLTEVDEAIHQVRRIVWLAS